MALGRRSDVRHRLAGPEHQVASFVAVALFVCGLLGDLYWLETARTIGFILVAVVICVVIGIPVGILCGRVDSAWQTVRPILDAMQVVHAFVYMLPIIWFFGVGETSATMVTMVFAIPPLIRAHQPRHTPSARRRGRGQPSIRRPRDEGSVRRSDPVGPSRHHDRDQSDAAAGHLHAGHRRHHGRRRSGPDHVQGYQQPGCGIGGFVGLAFFLVAVVLDRMSQREGAETGGLFKRIRMAWRYRRDPEASYPGRQHLGHRQVPPGRAVRRSCRQRESADADRADRRGFDDRQRIPDMDRQRGQAERLRTLERRQPGGPTRRAVLLRSGRLRGVVGGDNRLGRRPLRRRRRCRLPISGPGAAPAGWWPTGR